MKKIMCVLLVVVLCCCGCGNDIPTEKIDSPDKSILDFELIKSNNNNVIYYDKISGIMYYVFASASGYRFGFGITPIYGPDGQPMKYAHEAG